MNSSKFVRPNCAPQHSDHTRNSLIPVICPWIIWVKIVNKKFCLVKFDMD